MPDGTFHAAQTSLDAKARNLKVGIADSVTSPWPEDATSTKRVLIDIQVKTVVRWRL